MITLLGIRHHGPGSARSVRVALESLRPDCILVEGPPDADMLIPFVAHPDMRPPVALLLYLTDDPKQAVYYPFAEFSPEWQAIQYALKNKIPMRFMDLEQRYQLSGNVDHPSDPSNMKPDVVDANTPQPDPFAIITEAAGFSDGERWWEHFVEQRRSAGDVFQAILELMITLRVEAGNNLVPDHPQTLVREAAMRTILRAAQAQSHQNIAVVCGAWHVPALVKLDAEKSDAEVLSTFSDESVKTPTSISATWVPWTYDRLARRSGYGAGVDSPGWYEHLWHTESHLVEKWMVRVAHLMRAEDLAISPAHAIEATRLAVTLATLRGHPLPGLPELEEAIQAIFCFGDDTPMRLIHEKLIVGQRMGAVPADSPTVPLQRDISASQKHTRLIPSASPEILDLDLRKPLLLERSQLLHRLNLLGIPWGQLQTTRGVKGTFHELWQIEWKPEFAVAVIEASLWGNTVLQAATNRVIAEAGQAADLPALTHLVESALLSDLADSIPGLMSHLQRLAAVSGDIPHLMQALPPLANVLRYSNVRHTETGMVSHIVDELVTRICIGLPPACAALDDTAAGQMFDHITATQNALEILENESHHETWTRTLGYLAVQDGVHGLVRGRACRLLFDRSNANSDTARRMSQALSPGTPANQSAAWVQGFLYGSGQALIHHPRLWQLVDEWIQSLPEETFNATLPLLRRTFSTFPAPERRQIGEMAKSGGRVASATGDMDLDPVRVERALELVKMILGNGKK